MGEILKLAEKSLKEISDADERVKALSPKKQWIEKVKVNPKVAAHLYFEIFDSLVTHVGTRDKDWEKLSLLLCFNADPLAVKNKDGLNPLEYFYKRNREERLSLHDLRKKQHHLINQNEHRLESVANRLYHELSDMGIGEEQLMPVRKVQNLWRAYQCLIHKEVNTRRVAFSRLLKTVMVHPEDAVRVEDLQQMVQARLKQEEAEEKKAWDKWHQWEKTDYRARLYRPEGGHARGRSPLSPGLYEMFDPNQTYLLYRPLPESSKKALDDFLLSLKDEDAYWGLKIEQVLPEKRIKAYQRALNPPKRFERTR